MSEGGVVDEDIYVSVDSVRAGAGSDTSPLLPEALRQQITKTTAVLARQIATPNYEMLWFTRLARRLGFDALVIEHASDWFTVNNPTKLALVTLPIVIGRSRDGQIIMRRQKMLETPAAEGRRLDEIAFRSGERLVDYHHRKLREVLGSDAPNVLDLKELMPAGPGGPRNYYTEFFKMLSGPLVLFEDFVVDNQTAAFFRATVLPAWQSVVSTTGNRPQIVRLGPDRRTTSPLWSAYPASISDDRRWIRADSRAVRAERRPPDKGP